MDEKCPQCGINEATEPHGCPFQNAVERSSENNDGDQGEYCTCCEECCEECFQNV